MKILRFIFALIGLFCCFQLIVGAGRTGLSRLMSTLSIVQPGMEPADRAVQLAPNDPEAHYTRALALTNLGQLPEAVVELRESIRLRPHHYYEWLDLGTTLDRLDDQEGARAALQESVRLAPGFAQPRWQLGNLLFRQEKYEEAFPQLQLGAKSNPSLFNALLDLAWIAADGDVSRMEKLIKFESARDHLALANFLAKHEKGGDAARHVQLAGQPSDDLDRDLLHKTIEQLIATRQYSDAYVAWAATHGSVTGNGAKGPGQILNGDFVDPIPQNDPGFGWQLSSMPSVDASIDLSGPITNTRSISLKFGGDSAPGSQILSQIVLVQPKASYSVSFAARTEEIVTGGPLVISIVDASSQPATLLGQSTPLPIGTTDWKTNKVAFTTGEQAAIAISLQRLNCSQNPCPIFGRVWLSRFALTRE